MKRLFKIFIVLFVIVSHVKGQTSYLDAFWKPKTFDIPLISETSSLLSRVLPNVVVSVSISDTIAKVLPTLFGVNSNFRSGSSILERVPLYNQAKFGEFRFPAGSGSNTYFWDGILLTDLSILDPVKSLPIDGTKSAEINPAIFAQFLTSTKAQANIVVNYFYARYGKTDVDYQVGATDSQKRTARVQQAADYAAGFVRKMNIELKANVQNWEIGNECYGKWERDYSVNGINVIGTEYGEDFKVFAAAMKAVDPTIKVGAVVDMGNVIWSGQVLTQVKDVADFIFVHEYFTAENKATPPNILASITAIKANADSVNYWVIKYAGKPKGYYPIALTEFNSKGYSTTNMVNGMFFASLLGEIVKNKYGFSTSWVNEWSKGPDFSTHGLIASNDDPSQPPYSDKPLGPFTYAKNKPFSSRPEGFSCEAGHGSTFADKYGNYWHIATMTISVKHMFERRLVLLPTSFDKDENLYTNSDFGDSPIKMPNRKYQNVSELNPGWMLLSYNKPAKVSSSIDTDPVELAFNEDIRTYWSVKSGNIGEWLSVDLKSLSTIKALQINFAEYNTELYGRDGIQAHQYLVEYSTDEVKWNTMIDKTANSEDVTHTYFELNKPVKARYVRITNYLVPGGTFAISGFRIFGQGNSSKPSKGATFTAKLDAADRRVIALSWPKQDNAIGYNIVYGFANDKLYHNYQVNNATSVTINSLNKNQEYWFRIDSFGENGVSKGEIQKNN